MLTLAVESASKIVECFSTEAVTDYYLPMLKRLSSGDWFTSRTSACGLYASCYRLCSAENREQLRRYLIFTQIIYRIDKR